jgi:hypothetical protein
MRSRLCYVILQQQLSCHLDLQMSQSLLLKNHENSRNLTDSEIGVSWDEEINIVVLILRVSQKK